MGLELKKIGEQIAGAEVRPSVAIIQSYDTRFAFQVQANNIGFHFTEHLLQVYRALYRCRLPVNVVNPSADLSNYVMVVVPALYILDEQVAASLREYVMAGGTIVITPRTGVKDVSNMVVNLPLPGLMADVCGMKVTEYDSLPTDSRQPLEFVLSELADAPVAETRAWCDILQPETAEVVARYTQDYYAGKPAITLNRYGEGRAIYVGTFGDTPLYEGLFTWLMGLNSQQRTIVGSQGVEVAERWQGEKRIVFVLNHTTVAQAVVLETEYRNLLEPEQRCHGKTDIAPREVLVLEEVT
jgi:beta-galactosidase